MKHKLSYNIFDSVDGRDAKSKSECIGNWCGDLILKLYDCYTLLESNVQRTKVQRKMLMCVCKM